jgi:beta-N-acetylhexosaminidase
LVGWPGEGAYGAVSLLEEFKPAGFIYFRRNWPGSSEDLAGIIRRVNARAEKLLKRPLLWAIDQEGGTVQRLDDPPYALPPAAEMADIFFKDGPERVSSLTLQAGRALKELGFNFNLAPVLDVRAGDSYIASRSFSSDAETAALAAAAYAKGFREAGLLLCGKHFPGLGSSVTDPHRDLPLVLSGVQELWARDGLPFRRLISLGLPAVMTTHALYRSLDPLLPATFSSRILALLKKDYAFKGLVLTDDLEMEGLKPLAEPENSAVDAVVAGHDLALAGKDPDLIRRSRGALAEAVESGRLSSARLREAGSLLKKTLKLISRF